MSTRSDTSVSEARITTTSGSITVAAEAGLDDIVIDGPQPVVDGQMLTIETRSDRVRLRVPEGLDLVVGSTSGRIRIEGRLGAIAATSTSGKITVDDAESVDLRSSSGRIHVGRSRGETRIVAKSGRVTVDHSGPADVTSMSGRVTLADVDGPVAVSCTSGTIDVEMASAHDVSADTVSGRVRISLPPGTRAHIATPSGGVVPASVGRDCVVTARSASGRVDVSTR